MLKCSPPAENVDQRAPKTFLPMTTVFLGESINPSKFLYSQEMFHIVVQTHRSYHAYAFLLKSFRRPWFVFTTKPILLGFTLCRLWLAMLVCSAHLRMWCRPQRICTSHVLAKSIVKCSKCLGTLLDMGKKSRGSCQNVSVSEKHLITPFHLRCQGWSRFLWRTQALIDFLVFSMSAWYLGIFWLILDSLLLVWMLDSARCGSMFHQSSSICLIC